jgi:hypothetical protein
MHNRLLLRLGLLSLFAVTQMGCFDLVKLVFEVDAYWGHIAKGTGSFEDDGSGKLTGSFQASAASVDLQIEIKDLDLSESGGTATMTVSMKPTTESSLSATVFQSSLRPGDIECADGRPSFKAEPSDSHMETMTFSNLRTEHAPGSCASSGGGAGKASCTNKLKDECTQLLEGDVDAFRSTCAKQGATFTEGACALSTAFTCEYKGTTSGTPATVKIHWTRAACERIYVKTACERDVSGTFGPSGSNGCPN